MSHSTLLFPSHAGVIGGFVFLAALFFLILLCLEKKKMREFYEKNGGPILEKAKIIKLFKKEELKKILKSKNLIGKGCFGEVYKGLLDNKLVAVKKPRSGNVLENEQFANEVIIQSQVIHKNIVRLIGCCLEVNIPMLVYEFLPKGNLEDILHSDKNVLPLNIDLRLSIAAQSADGLAYMHSKTNNKILHGDVKPANILLDENFMPKISDFGISRLIARDKEHADNVIGDRSYMDPVYMQTGLLTEKSDVYSFGVVILELVCRKKATYSDNNSLVRNFLEAHKVNRVAELFDNEIALTSNLGVLHSLSRIAVECLNLDVDQRPSMIEVAERLLLLNRSHNP
jgi:serine/threonine protein kinase